MWSRDSIFYIIRSSGVLQPADFVIKESGHIALPLGQYLINGGHIFLSGNPKNLSLSILSALPSITLHVLMDDSKEV